MRKTVVAKPSMPVCEISRIISNVRKTNLKTSATPLFRCGYLSAVYDIRQALKLRRRGRCT